MPNGVSHLMPQISQPLSGVQTSSQPSQTQDPKLPDESESVAEVGVQPRPPPPLSPFSSPGVPDSAWCAHDFLLGAGMVIIQKNTHKIVVLYETKLGYWFFPRGRKDVGESIEQAAYREAYEESGFRVQPLALLIPSRQPQPPSVPRGFKETVLNTEPIYMTMTSWQPRRMTSGEYDDGGQYLTTWFAGQIAEDAVPEAGTGMPDEQNFESYLLPYEEAINRVWGSEVYVLKYVWHIYLRTQEAYRLQEEEAKKRADQRRAEADGGRITIRRKRSAP